MCAVMNWHCGRYCMYSKVRKKPPESYIQYKDIQSQSLTSLQYSTVSDNDEV